MTIEVVLFDIDGTLVDSNEQHVNAWVFAFREAGHPQELDDIRAQIGKGGDLLVPELLPDVDDAVRKGISERQGDYFKDMYLDNVGPFEGAAALIKRVHASGRKVVLASSAKRDELDHYVGLMGIEACLAATTSIDDVETSKPEPDLFALAIGKVGVEPSNALVVGDTIYDVDAALRAGIATVGVTSGPFDESQLKEAGAIAVFADVASILRDFDQSPLAR
ncbi:HAD family hydrolase [Sphingomonas nostoxanthinifaciens]|uniref:HAD family hydrolase n=1 Tax=Sphingomonas nostoxanthinifaciens TaxID=2872652 RepID=UPI001CC206EB|nr:HAD family hydrolase [Sphingomonas nostoxanthinifaciens]UAK25567.1 HAD family hydrolase [Sphingomonas nostoxanthinifaciens]